MTHSSEITIEDWKLSSDEIELVEKKNISSRLGYAVLYKHFNLYGRFPKPVHELHRAAIHELANQLNLDGSTWNEYSWTGRSIKRHRTEIRQLFGYRVAAVKDSNRLIDWLCANTLIETRRHEHIESMAYEHLQALRIEPPTPERLDRLIRSAIKRADQQLCKTVSSRLSVDTYQLIECLLDSDVQDTDEFELRIDRNVLQGLRSDSGPSNLDSLLREIDKLNQLRALNLPEHLFNGISSKIVTAYQERAAVEQPHELRRHPVELRITLLCAYCYNRMRELTDTLVDLLIILIQRIGARAERKVEKEFLADFKRVSGKTGLLFQLAEISLDHPEGVVQDVIYPVVNETVLKSIVKEWKSSGPLYHSRVQLKSEIPTVRIIGAC